MILRQTRPGKAASVILAIAVIAALLILAPTPALAAAGGLDNSFDGNGRLATDFNSGFDVVTDMVVQADGKVIVAGVNGSTGLYGNAAIARYNVDGSLDTTFSGDGKLILPAACSRVVVASRGNTGSSIYVAYFLFAPTTPSQLFITRLSASGDPDEDFDTDGTATLSTLENFVLGDIAVQDDGKVIVVGGSSGTATGGTTPSDWLLWRFTSTGALDSGFSGDGQQQTDFGGNLTEFATSVTILENGAIMVGGTGNPAGNGFALARYTTNGSIDTNWGGGDGKVFSDLSPGIDIPRSMQVQTDARIVLAGSSHPGGVQTGTIVRYTSDGLPDPSFDGDGIVQTASFGPVVEGVALHVLDGKIIGVGGATDFIVGRLNTNGTPDTSFGIGGFVTTDMTNNSDDEAKTVAIAFDRRIVVAGSTLNTAAGSNRNFCSARYLPTNIPYHAPFDFDGDGESDYGIFRPGNGQWWVNLSSTRTLFSSTTVVYTFGNASNRLAPLDFTGDGKADVAFWHPQTGEWFVLRSENFSFYSFPFGSPGDFAVPGDYDADGKADAAVFRPTTSTWYLSQSGGGPTQFVQFGINGDRPVVADYDEDGRSDIGIYRPGPSEWWIQRSSAGLLAMQFGSSGDKPVQGDYTGDGKADIAMFRPSSGEWYVVRSEDSSFYGFPFGAADDVPAPADYDGDGRFDPTVVRGATWFIGRTSGTTQIFGFGVVGDRPIPNAFVP